jgi:hypothetical protein
MIMLSELQKLQWKALVALARYVLTQKGADWIEYREQDQDALYDLVLEDERSNQ